MADISNVKGSFGGNLARGVASGAASGMAGGLMDALFGGVSAGRQWKYYQKQMELQDQYLQAQERRQQAYFEANRDNERNYSSPTAQRSRMAAAGINPFAAEGAGVSSGASLDASSPTGAGVGGNAINGQSRFNVDPLAAAQIEVLRSQADLNNAEAGRARGDTHDPGETLRGQQLNNNLTEQRIINDKTRNQLDQFDLDFKEASRSNDLSIIEAKLANIRSQNDVLNAQLQNELDKHENNPYIREEIQSRIFMNYKQTAMLEAQVELTRKGVEVADTDIWLKLAQASHLRELTNIAESEAVSAKAKADIDSLVADARTGKGSFSGRDGSIFVERLRSAISAIYGGSN